MTDLNYLSNVKISENTQQIEEKKQKFTFEKSDGIFAIVFFVLGYLYVQWAYPFRPALSTALFVVMFVIIGIVYGNAAGFKQSKKSIPYLVILLLGALRFVVFDNDLPGVMLFMFITFMAVYWVGVFAKKRIGANNGKDKISSLFIWDILNQLLNVPFSHFACAFGSIKHSFGKGKNSSTSGQILIGILICIPVAFVVITLLASADAAFDNLVSILYDMFFGKIYSSVIKLFIAIPVWCYFFGLFYGNLRNRSFNGITAESVEKVRKGMCKMPKVTAYTVLTVINLIYILFFVSQSAYLFSGFSNLLPEEFTYSQYARKGFFELCVIAFINFGITYLSFVIVERNSEGKRPKALTVQIMLLSVFTLLLIATALSKMAMYIDCYGLTRLRIYASWFMVMLFIMFIIIIAKSAINFNAPKAAFVVFCVGLFALCFSNIDGYMTKYNISRFEKGTLDTFSPYDYRSLSAGSVPYLYEFYNNITTDGEYIGKTASESGNTNKGVMALNTDELIQLKTDIEMVIKNDESSFVWYNGDFKTFNIQAYNAQKMVFGNKS